MCTLAVAFLSPYQADAAPPPIPYDKGEVTASANIQGIAGVTQAVMYIFPNSGFAQYNLENAQGQDVYQGDFYFAPLNGHPSKNGVTPQHPLIEDEYIVATRRFLADTSINNGNPGYNIFSQPYQVGERHRVRTFNAGYIERRIRGTTFYDLQIRNGAFHNFRVPAYTPNDGELNATVRDFVNTADELRTAENAFYFNVLRNAGIGLTALALAVLQHLKGIPAINGTIIAFAALAAVVAIGVAAIAEYRNVRRLITKLERLYYDVHDIVHHQQVGPPPGPDGPDPGVSGSFSMLQIRHNP